MIYYHVTITRPPSLRDCITTADDNVIHLTRLLYVFVCLNQTMTPTTMFKLFGPER